MTVRLLRKLCFPGPSLSLTLVLLLTLFPMSAVAEAAPGFSLRDSQGMSVSLADFRGQPLVLHFWATWCPYCKKLQPGLERLGREHEATGLVVLGISFREDEGVAPQAVLEQRGLTFKTLVEGDDVAKSYGVRGTPTTFFIDRAGNVVAMTNTSNPEDPILEQHAQGIIGRMNSSRRLDLTEVASSWQGEHLYTNPGIGSGQYVATDYR